MILATLGVAAALILINAVYVAAEFAIVGVRRSRVRQLAGEGSRLARWLLPAIESPADLDRYIAACQIGITLSGLLLGAFAQSSIAPLLAPRLAGATDAAVVKEVVDAAAPNRDAKHQDAWPTTRAGIFISGGKYGVEFHLTQQYTKFNGVLAEQLTRSVWVDTWYPGGGSGSQLARTDPEKPTYLRITRKEKTITVSHSADGKEWSAPFSPRQGLDFPVEVTVGVFFSHTTHQSADATFADFTIGEPKKDEKPMKK